MRIIDSHIHIEDLRQPLLSVFADLDLSAINICVGMDAHGAWRDQVRRYRRYQEQQPDRFAWVTAFDMPRNDDPNYARAVIEQLEADFALGAIGVKVWKNIGMEAKAADGRFVQIDAPLFQPIWDYLAEIGKPVLGHLADPAQCWQPLGDSGPHAAYYRSSPEWHMYGRQGQSHRMDIIAARDRLLERNPRLRFVGAHLASLEHDLDEVAKRLDAFPNMAIDTSARLWDVAVQPREKVRRFFDKYRDRVLFGTDLSLRVNDHTNLPEAAQDEALAANLRIAIADSLTYYQTDSELELFGTTCRGIALPDCVLRSFLRDNAIQWYPGAFAR